MQTLKKILRLKLGCMAIIFAVIGLFVFGVRNTLFDPETYNAAIYENGFYEFTKNIASEKLLSSKLIEEEKLITESTESELNKLLFAAIIEEVNTEELLQVTIENNIDKITKWANSRNDELILYFPREKLREEFQDEQLENMITRGLDSLFGFSTLPICTPEQEDALHNLETINIFDLECIPESFHKELAKAVNESVNVEIGNVVDTLLDESEFYYLDEEIPIMEIIEKMDTPEKEQENISNAIDDTQYYLGLSKIVPYLLLVVSIILSVLYLSLGQRKVKKYIKEVAKFFFAVGTILFSTSFLINYLVSQKILGTIQWNQTPWEKVFAGTLTEESIQLSEIVQGIVNSILWNIFRSTMQLGIILTTIAILVFLTIFTVKKAKEYQNKSSKTIPTQQH